MEELEARVHRTLLDVLITGNMKAAARALVNADIRILIENFNPYGWSIDLPTVNMMEVQQNDELRSQIDNALRLVSHGHVTDQNGGRIDVKDLQVEYRIKLIDDVDAWQSKIAKMLEEDAGQPRLGT